MGKSEYGCKRRDADWILIAPIDDDTVELRGTSFSAHMFRAKGDTIRGNEFAWEKIKDLNNDFPNIPWADGCGPDAEATPEPKWKVGDLVKIIRSRCGIPDAAKGHHAIILKDRPCNDDWLCRVLSPPAGMVKDEWWVRADPGEEEITDPDPAFLAGYNAGKAAR